MTLIALNHAGVLPSTPFLLLVEGVLTLTAGPMLILFAGSVLGSRVLPIVLLFAPVVLFLASATLAPGATLRSIPVDRLVFIQMVYTAGVGLMTIRAHAGSRRAAANQRLVLTTVGAMTALHVAQIARSLFPHEQALSNIVPWVGAILFSAAAGAVFLGGRVTALEPLTESLPKPTAETAALADSIDRALAGGLLKNSQLSLNEVAEVVGVTSEATARAVVAARGMSFAEYLVRLRIEEAKRLLGDPKEARTSMEAIGALAGFGSRSAFYQSFGDQVGMSPAAYRRDIAAERVQKPKSGQQSSV